MRIVICAFHPRKHRRVQHEHRNRIYHNHNMRAHTYRLPQFTPRLNTAAPRAGGARSAAILSQARLHMLGRRGGIATQCPHEAATQGPSHCCVTPGAFSRKPCSRLEIARRGGSWRRARRSMPVGMQGAGASTMFCPEGSAAEHVHLGDDRALCAETSPPSFDLRTPISRAGAW